MSGGSDDVLYKPDEIDRLLAEYRGAQPLVKDPHAVWGLDKLIRTVRWARKLEFGIFFEGRRE